jgi:hypothetical protein
MKKLLSNSLILFGVLTYYSAAKAQHNETTPTFVSEVYIAHQEARVHVVVNRMDNRSQFTIQLRNEKGQVMYKEALPKGEIQYRFVFDLLEAASGNYFIEMQDGKQPPVIKVLQKEYTVLAKTITTNTIIALN